MSLEDAAPPDWAVGAGRDPQGEFADVLIRGRQHRMRRRAGAGWAGPAGLGADQFGVFEDLVIARISLRFRYIPAGTFVMGAPGEDFHWRRETPRHSVTLSEPFWLAEAPITQALWHAVMGYNPADFKGAQRPVEQISWDDVLRFIDQAERRSAGVALRMPTEAQWEYACRASTTTPRYGALDDVAWYSDNNDSETRPVKHKQPNAWSLFDMLGNVDEWTRDHAYRTYESGAVVDPVGPAVGPLRAVRGGSWADTAQDVRAGRRDGILAEVRHQSLGARLSREGGPSAGPE